MAITKVEFYNNDVLIGERTTSPFNTFQWLNAPEGEHVIIAKIYVDGELSDTSNPVTINVVDDSINLPDWFLPGDLGTQYMNAFETENSPSDYTQSGNIALTGNVGDGMLLDPNGNIFMNSSYGYTVLNPTTGTNVKYERDTTTFYSGKSGFVLDLNGFVYSQATGGAVSTSDQIIKFDPTNNYTQSFAFQPSNNFKYEKALVNNDGDIFFFGVNEDFSKVCIRYSPDGSKPLKTATIGNVEYPFLSPNGDILFWNITGLRKLTNEVVVVNPNTASSLRSNTKPVIGADGFIYGIANHELIKIHPSTHATTQTGITLSTSGSYLMFNTSDSRILILKWGAQNTTHFMFNPKNGTLQTTNVIDNGYVGGLLLPDGRIALMRSSNYVDYLGDGSASLSNNLLLSRYKI